MYNFKDRLPEKGKNIKALDVENNIYYLFRCACNNENCVEFRDQIVGSMIMVDIIKWEYDE